MKPTTELEPDGYQYVVTIDEDYVDDEHLEKLRVAIVDEALCGDRLWLDNFLRRLWSVNPRCVVVLAGCESQQTVTLNTSGYF